ncbi:hypothetical protein [Candidatus Laterigemmans baculatus]|uniref:hypothetical protein n=1 Tax=Candidatus Laterigemmans baculatus TaxID=2770505 RepID=UPI0013DB449F|nr:hypothetical protein [Candidatus Laterigemmans baculatus]
MPVDNLTIEQLAKEICELNDKPGGNPEGTEEFEVLEEVIAEAPDVQQAVNAAWRGVRSHRWQSQQLRQTMLSCMSGLQRRVERGKRK